MLARVVMKYGANPHSGRHSGEVDESTVVKKVTKEHKPQQKKTTIAIHTQTTLVSARSI